MQSPFGRNQRTWIQETDDYLEKGEPSKRPEPIQPSWLRLLLEPTVIAIMVSCISLALGEFIKSLSMEIDSLLFMTAPVIGAFVGYRSWIVTQRKLLDGSDRTRKLLIELAVMFLLIKGIPLLGMTVPALMNVAGSWSNKPLSFFDGQTMIAFSITIVAWLVGLSSARDLTAIHDLQMYAGELGPIQRLFRRFLIGGIVLLIITTLGRISLEDIVLQQYARISGPKLNILLYFILGLIMLGQIRFARMSSLWQLQDVNIGHALKRRWLRYSLILIAGISILALFLPTQYALSIMDIISWVFTVIGLIVTILYFIIITPFVWLYSLLFRETQTEPFEMGPIPPMEPSSLQQTGSSPSWIQVMQSILFWLIGLFLLFYIIRSYIRDHPDTLRSLRKIKLFSVIEKVWHSFRRWWRTTLRRLRKRSEQAYSPISGESRYRVAAPGGTQNNPAGRNAILKAYYNTLDRARKWGISRKPTQTPDEFQPRLEQATEQPQAVDALTQLFIKAHYSQGDITDAEVAKSQENAKILRKALRQRKTSEPPNKTSPDK